MAASQKITAKGRTLELFQSKHLNLNYLAILLPLLSEYLLLLKI